MAEDTQQVQEDYQVPGDYRPPPAGYFAGGDEGINAPPPPPPARKKSRAEQAKEAQEIAKGLRNLVDETWAKKEVTLGDTTFYIDKMRVLEAWPILNLLRFEVGKTRARHKLTGGTTDLMQLLLLLDPGFLNYLREQLFKSIRYRNSKTSVQDLISQQGDSSEDMAFENQEPGVVIELIARSLAVNFMPSLHAMSDKILDFLTLASDLLPQED